MVERGTSGLSPRALEALHLALPPSGRLMRILGPIVFPSPAVMQVVDAEIEGCCAVGRQIIRDHSFGREGVLHQFQRGVLVALGLDQHINLFPTRDPVRVDLVTKPSMSDTVDGHAGLPPAAGWPKPTGARSASSDCTMLFAVTGLHGCPVEAGDPPGGLRSSRSGRREARPETGRSRPGRPRRADRSKGARRRRGRRRPRSRSRSRTPGLGSCRRSCARCARDHLGGTPPAHLPRWLLLRVLAFQNPGRRARGSRQGDAARHSSTERPNSQLP